jgi:hypothetical protein
VASRSQVTRNLSLRVSEETYAKLASMTPASETISGVARRVLEKVLGTGGELPALVQSGAPRIATVDFGKVLSAIAELREHLSDTQRETLRAVQEQRSWARRRLLPKGDAVLDQLARDEGEQLVREWERSVGR